MMSIDAIRALTNTGVRAQLHRTLGARRLYELGGPLPGDRVLEVGCGRGLGVEQIREVFGAPRIDAFDFDPKMVALAQARVGHMDGVRVWQGDATRIDAPDATYDAVVEFIVLHHIPGWRDAVREIFRVLRPGGVFYAEEILPGGFIPGVVARRSGYLAQTFSHRTFPAALAEAGFEVQVSRSAAGVFGWYVARKPE